MKIFWGIISISLLVVIVALPAFRNWVINVYTIIIQLNYGFFANMPPWFNLGISTLVIAVILMIANSFRE